MAEEKKENVASNVSTEAEKKLEKKKEKVNKLRDDTKEERDDIEEILRKADNGLKAKKQELYIKKLNSELKEKGIKEKSYEELTVAQRREAEAFEIPDAEMKELIDDTAKKIQEKTNERNEAINGFEDEIQNLYNEAQSHVEELTAKLENPELKEEEKTELTNELNGWKKLMEDIGPEKGSTSPIRSVLGKAITNHNEARMNGAKGMAIIYPKDKVYNNEEVKRFIPKDKVKEFEQQAKEEGQPREGGNKEEQVNNEKAAPGGAAPAAAKAAQQVAGQGATSQPDSVSAVGEDPEEEISLKPDYLEDVLRYNPNNALNFDNSSDLLSHFAAPVYTDKERLEMLNDPACKDVILKALNITGKNLNPKKSKAFNDTRDKILKLAKGPMMERALKDLGIEDSKNIKKDFNEAYKQYNNQKSILENQLKGDLSEEDRANTQKALDDLNEKYESIKNVADFQQSSKQIKTIRTRLNSFKDAILNKDSYRNAPKMIASAASGVKEKVDDFMYEKADDDFHSRMKGATNTKEQQLENDIKSINKDTRAVEEKEIDGQSR